jgi:hypothetical protein
MTVESMEQVQSEYADLLGSVFDFMRKSGIPQAEVQRICAQALNESGRRDMKARPGRSATLSTAALVLDAWHRNRRYVDRNGAPRAIPLLGESPSVEALIRSETTSSDACALARRLTTLGLLVRQRGNEYKPAKRIALIAGLDPTIQQYIARASATLLKTIRHNISRTDDSMRLIERFAEIPDLPRHRAAEFRRFARIQGWEFIRTLNDWLEARRARRLTAGRKHTVRAGVHLYAYVEASRRKVRRRRRSTTA